MCLIFLYFVFHAADTLVSEFSVTTMMNRVTGMNSILSCSTDVWGIGRELHTDHRLIQKPIHWFTTHTCSYKI